MTVISSAVQQRIRDPAASFRAASTRSEISILLEWAQSGHLTKTLRQVKQIEAFKVSNADKVSFRCDCANVAFQALVGNSMNNI